MYKQLKGKPICLILYSECLMTDCVVTKCCARSIKTQVQNYLQGLYFQNHIYIYIYIYIYINGFIVIFSIALTVSTSKQQLPTSNSYNIANSNLRLICDVCKSLWNQDASKWGNTTIWKCLPKGTSQNWYFFLKIDRHFNWTVRTEYTVP